MDRLISEERIRRLQEIYPHTLLVELLRQRLEQARLSIAAGNSGPSVDVPSYMPWKIPARVRL